MLQIEGVPPTAVWFAVLVPVEIYFVKEFKRLHPGKIVRSQAFGELVQKLLIQTETNGTELAQLANENWRFGDLPTNTFSILFLPAWQNKRQAGAWLNRVQSIVDASFLIVFVCFCAH
jgi:hypothetical protein